MLFFKDGFLNTKHELFKVYTPKEANDINLILNKLYEKRFISYPRTTSNKQTTYWIKDSMLCSIKCESDEKYSNSLVRLSEVDSQHLGILPVFGDFDEDEEPLTQEEKHFLSRIYKYYLNVISDSFKIEKEHFSIIERHRFFFLYEKNDNQYCIDKKFLKNRNKLLKDFNIEDLEYYKLIND